jgi:hypothetical protein
LGISTYNWVKLDEDQSEHVGLAQQNGFGPGVVCSLLRLKGHNKPKHLPEKRVIKILRLVVPVSDCVIIMIGPGGLSLVTPDLFAVPVLALWVRLEYSK